MSNKIAVKDTAARLLTPNDTLDVRIFDQHGKMYPDLRKALLAEAELVAKRSLAGLKGIKVKDIYLNGSSAGYFYYDKSDLDVRIEVVNENCSFITNDDELLEQFLTIIKQSTFPNVRFHANGRFADIKINTRTFEIMGLYSILNDRWVIEPRKDITADLNIDDIMEEYTKRFYKIKNYMRDMISSGKTKTMEGIEEIEAFYKKCIRENNFSAREYIIYKLLNYRGIHKQLQELFNDSLKDILSLTDSAQQTGISNTDAKHPEAKSPNISQTLGADDITYTLPPLYEIKI